MPGITIHARPTPPATTTSYTGIKAKQSSPVQLALKSPQHLAPGRIEYYIIGPVAFHVVLREHPGTLEQLPARLYP